MKQLSELIQTREELLEFLKTHNLMEEKHYMKFLQLQDTNLEILKLKEDYDFKNG